MTDYKNIFGKPVKFLTTDPDNEQAEGQIWYNSTADAFKSVVVGKAWSSAANMIEKSRLMAGFGIQTAAVSAGGADDTASLATTQEYNGTGWSLGGNLPEARFNAGGLGVETAGMSVGGGDPPGARSVKTFEYNGSSWTAGGNLTEEREGPFSFGTETAGVAAGGESLLPPGVSQVATVDEYNGTSWTAVNSMSNARYLGAACGTETAGVVFGGETSGGGGYITATEKYDGTIWTAGGNVPSSQQYAQAASGQQTNALLINGWGPPYTTTVSEYDGSTFTTGQSTAIPRSQLGASKQQANTTNALAYGGLNPGVSGGPRLSYTEEYLVSANVITGAAWSSGGNLPAGRSSLKGAGTQTAGIGFGGYTGPPGSIPSTVVTLKYDGSSWTTSGNLNTARVDGGPSSDGSQTAVLYFGGKTAFSTPTDAEKTNATESFDGSTWSTLPATMNTTRHGIGGAGTQTAALAFGGGVSPGATPTTATESYDGSTWTSVNSMNTSRRYISGCGTQTLALAASGFPGGGVEEWDGSTWTISNNSNLNRQNYGALCGVQTSALLGGGGSGGTPFDGATEKYDGTSWVSAPNMAVGRLYIGAASASASNASMGFGGSGYTTSTEEFTGETSALNIKTITTS
jgi:hypothetical protein